MKHVKPIVKKLTKKKAVKKKVEPTNKPTETATPSEPEKVFDVARPGESMAMASGKPIIANRSPVQDPMVTPQQQPVPQDADPLAAPDEAKLEARTSKSRIEPLTHKEDEEGVVADPAEVTEEPTTEDSSGGDSDSSDDETSDLSAKDQQKSAVAAEDIAAEKRQAQANALIESKLYFVPVNAVKKRRSLLTLLVVVVILAVIFGFLAALDAGLVDIGVTPPTDFISD